MNLVFDTSILIAIERNNKNIIKKLNELYQLYPAPPQLTFISYLEYLIGLKIRKTKLINASITFLNSFNVINTTTLTADILSDLRIKYDKKGITLPLADMLSASIAIENGLIMITADKDFEKIEELKKIIL